MKNLFFSLAFMLIGSFAFANNVETSTPESFSKLSLKTVVINFEDLKNINLEDFKECHVKVTGNVNGKPVNLDIIFTSESGDCINDTVRLVKDLIDKMN